jgi:hypothetical protein
MYENRKYNFEVPLNLKGNELKKLFIEEAKIDETKHKIKLFFGGSEILDEHKLYQHNLKDEYQLLVMLKIIEDNI